MNMSVTLAVIAASEAAGPGGTTAAVVNSSDYQYLWTGGRNTINMSQVASGGIVNQTIDSTPREFPGWR